MSTGLVFQKSERSDFRICNCDLCEVLFNWVYFDGEIVLVLNDLIFI